MVGEINKFEEFPKLYLEGDASGLILIKLFYFYFTMKKQRVCYFQYHEKIVN